MKPFKLLRGYDNNRIVQIDVGRISDEDSQYFIDRLTEVMRRQVGHIVLPIREEVIIENVDVNPRIIARYPNIPVNINNRYGTIGITEG
jgi:hypothetical protein